MAHMGFHVYLGQGDTAQYPANSRICKTKTSGPHTLQLLLQLTLMIIFTFVHKNVPKPSATLLSDPPKHSRRPPICKVFNGRNVQSLAWSAGISKPKP